MKLVKYITDKDGNLFEVVITKFKTKQYKLKIIVKLLS